MILSLYTLSFLFSTQTTTNKNFIPHKIISAFMYVSLLALSLSFSKKTNKKTIEIVNHKLAQFTHESYYTVDSNYHITKKKLFFLLIYKNTICPPYMHLLTKHTATIHKFDNILHQNVLFSAGSQNATLSLRNKESRVHLSTAHTHTHTL